MLDNLCVVLVSPRNPLNIGAAARAMSNFGCADLRLVSAYRVAADEARSAVKADEVIQQAREFDTLAPALSDCTLVVGTTSVGHREVHHRLVKPDVAAREIRKHCALTGKSEAGRRVALLFGSEKFGLSNDDLAFCHFLTRIPARAEHGSINLGQAVAICLYELVRSVKSPVQAGLSGRKNPAQGEDVERLCQLLLEGMRVSGYLGKQDQAPEQKLRRLVTRMDLNAADARVWQGIVRQMLWKMRQTAGSELREPE